MAFHSLAFPAQYVTWFANFRFMRYIYDALAFFTGVIQLEVVFVAFNIVPSSHDQMGSVHPISKLTAKALKAVPYKTSAVHVSTKLRQLCLPCIKKCTVINSYFVRSTRAN